MTLFKVLEIHSSRFCCLSGYACLQKGQLCRGKMFECCCGQTGNYAFPQKKLSKNTKSTSKDSWKIIENMNMKQNGFKICKLDKNEQITFYGIYLDSEAHWQSSRRPWRFVNFVHIDFNYLRYYGYPVFWETGFVQHLLQVDWGFKFMILMGCNVYLLYGNWKESILK